VRSRRESVLSGVCGGVGRHLGVDPLRLRVAAAAFAVSGGVGVIAYMVAWGIRPKAGDD
jgi:phage shock protein C